MRKTEEGGGGEVEKSEAIKKGGEEKGMEEEGEEGKKRGES